MNLQVRIRGTTVSDAFRARAERCLGFALRRFARRVDRVSVWLIDVNGPRGGIDKCCRIAVRLRPMGSAFVTERASDAYAALDRAAGRAGRAVARRIGRDHRGKPGFSEPRRKTDHLRLAGTRVEQ
jgi:putative sigma-54 modulation protein